MKRFISKKAIAVGLAAGLALGVSGAAIAYWTQGGSGTGTASTGTTTDVTVNQTSTVADLYPGGPAQALSGDFDNPNPGEVYVGTVTASLGTLPAGCVAADFDIQGTGVVNDEIGSGSGVGAWSGITIAMVDTGVSQDDCKADTIPLDFTLSAS
jgi:hypothetical protein